MGFPLGDVDRAELDVHMRTIMDASVVVNFGSLQTLFDSLKCAGGQLRSTHCRHANLSVPSKECKRPANTPF